MECVGSHVVHPHGGPHACNIGGQGDRNTTSTIMKHSLCGYAPQATKGCVTIQSIQPTRLNRLGQSIPLSRLSRLSRSTRVDCLRTGKGPRKRTWPKWSFLTCWRTASEIPMLVRQLVSNDHFCRFLNVSLVAVWRFSHQVVSSIF